MSDLGETIDVEHKEGGPADPGLDDRSAAFAHDLEGLVEHVLFHTDDQCRRSPPQESTGRGDARNP